MAIKTYSWKKDGDLKLSTNFKVKEFRSKCGSDKILIDEKLVVLLQKLRDKFGAINISSAYRSPEHNRKVGGVSNSQHVYGRAADITLGTNNTAERLREVAKYAETIGFTGIGLDDKYQMFIHVDTRPNKSFFKYNKNGSTYSVSTFGGKAPTTTTTTTTATSYAKGSKGETVKNIQSYLNTLGYLGANGKILTVDGDFGANVDFAVRNFQKENDLTVDGIVGTKTIALLKTMASKVFNIQITANTLNVRKGPGKGYDIVGVAKKNEKYIIVNTSGDWGYLKSHKGWISLSYGKKI